MAQTNREHWDVSSPSEDEFAERVLESLKEVFWDPEVERRGGTGVTGPIVKALAILRPGEPVEVRLNSEVELVARARVNASVSRGDAVTAENVDDIEALEPLDVDPNAGWVAYALLPDGRPFAAFDFVRNRGRSMQLLALAREYLSTAKVAKESRLLGPVIENLMAAAELAITAQIYSFQTDVPERRGRRNAHSARLHWTRVQVGLENTVPTAHMTLQKLNTLRGACRYGEGELPGQDVAQTLFDSVCALVEDATTRVGQPLRTQDPDFAATIRNAEDRGTLR